MGQEHNAGSHQEQPQVSAGPGYVEKIRPSGLIQVERFTRVGQSEKAGVTNTINRVAAGEAKLVDTSSEETKLQEGEGQTKTDEKAVLGQENENRAESADKVKERVAENRHRRLEEAVKATDEQLGIKPEEKDKLGLPTDQSRRTEYVRTLAENSEKAENQAVEDTVRQQFEEEHPPPTDGDPAKLAEWAKGYNDYKKSMNEAQQEADQEARAAVGEGGGNKQAGSEQSAVEENRASTDGKSETKGQKEKEDNSASMGNAWKLANALENAKDDKARENIEKKIDAIHNANQKIRPRFKARVTIAKAVLFGRTLAVMGALGVASSAASKVAESAK